MTTPDLPASIDELQQRLLALDYVADRQLATAVYLALKLQRPLFLEGEPGTGKTEIARTLSADAGARADPPAVLRRPRSRWRGLRMELRPPDAGDPAGRRHRAPTATRWPVELFSSKFLIQRALLQAIDPARQVPPVLLIDELDRADEPFEAFLLEVLSEFQITIPEFGTVKAATPPIVVLTSNRTREIHDAVKRRCLYHWVGFPDAARELQVLQRRVPGVAQQLAQQVVGFVQRLRQVELYKQPGIAETIEWARALMQLDALVLDPAVIQDTLGVLLKYQDDIARMQGGEAARLLEEVRNAARAPA